MKNKLAFANYDVETGLAHVGITTPLGFFEAHSKVHEEDKDIASCFIGCEIAEKKAYIKALKAKRNQISIEIKALTDFYKRLECFRWFNPDSHEAIQLRKAIDEKKAAKEAYENLISAYKDAIATRNENRRKFLKKVEDKRG